MSEADALNRRYTNRELKELKEERLLDMLFQRDFPEGISSRQAAYELARRQESHRNRLQILFAALAALSAFASAVAAIATLWR